MTKPTTQYYFWADATRIFSIFLVVLLHTSAGLVYQWGKISPDWWWAGNLYDSFSRVSVPLFVMLSGALLLPKTEKYNVFFHKRIKRILIPWIVWASIYVLWAIIWDGRQITSFAELKALYIQTFLGGFWFLVMLMGLYLLTPLWRLFIQNARRSDYIYLFLMWFFLASIVPLVGIFSGHYFFATLPLSFKYSGYFVLGYFLSKEMVGKISPKWLMIIGVGMSLLIAGATFGTTLAHDQFKDIFYDFLTPFQVICAISFFLLFTSWSPRPSSFFSINGNLIKRLSQSTLGIYLLHNILLDVFRRYFLVDQFFHFIHPLIAIPLIACTVFVLSFAIIAGARSFKVGRVLT